MAKVLFANVMDSSNYTGDSEDIEGIEECAYTGGIKECGNNNDTEECGTNKKEGTNTGSGCKGRRNIKSNGTIRQSDPGANV